MPRMQVVSQKRCAQRHVTAGGRPLGSPMLWSVGMEAISCSSALYLRSSASNASSVGWVRMNAS